MFCRNDTNGSPQLKYYRRPPMFKTCVQITAFISVLDYYLPTEDEEGPCNVFRAQDDTIAGNICGAKGHACSSPKQTRKLPSSCSLVRDMGCWFWKFAYHESVPPYRTTNFNTMVDAIRPKQVSLKQRYGSLQSLSQDCKSNKPRQNHRTYMVRLFWNRLAQ